MTEATKKLNIRTRRVAVALVLALSCAAIAAFAQTSQDSRLAQKRGAHLRHGINLSEWFAQVYDQKAYTKEHFETRSEEHTSELQSLAYLVCRLLLEKKNTGRPQDQS